MEPLQKMAKQTHKQISVVGDTVIIAASPITGNEAILSKTVDMLFRLGAKVIFR